ncbi:TPA: hypothetical protein PC790_000798 [Clostridioides difficile]|nr:hypothetical protein [Clostridioides difficile]
MNTEIKRTSDEILIDNDIINQKDTTLIGYGDNHRGRVIIGSSMYLYTRRLKDPFQVQKGENPYAYTLERVGELYNI